MSANVQISTLLALCFVLAGCAAEGNPASTSAAPAVSSSAPKATVGLETGGLEGSVVDDEQQPMAGIRVGIVESAATATTAADGRYSFSDLAPGNYRVGIYELGFEHQVKAATIVAGEVTELNFLLIPVPVSVARERHYTSDGYLELSAGLPAFTYNRNSTGTARHDFYYNVDPDVVSAVNGMTWQSGTPGTARKMRFSLWATTNSCVSPGLCKLVNNTYGFSPLVLRYDDYQAEFEGLSKPQVNSYFYITSCMRGAGASSVGYAADCQKDPDTVAQVAYEQRFTVYTSVFYVEPAPAGFSPLPK